MDMVDLSKYDNSWFIPGRGFLVRIIWYFVNALFLQNPFNPSSSFKIFILKLFGAHIGQGVFLKPSINVKYPWNLEIGDYTWIGEKVWLDSLAKIKIGSNACISQGAYLCTGNHNWSDITFRLIIDPIYIEDGAWIGAKAIVLPGVTVGSHSVITAGSVVTKNAESFMIYTGNPAVNIGKREINIK